jgi:hypothetical protein
VLRSGRGRAGGPFSPFLLLVLAVLVLYGTSPVVTNGDSYLAIPTAVSLVHDGDLDLDEFSSPEIRTHYGLREVEGHRYDTYPWAVALLAVPAVLAVDALHAVGVGPGAAALVERDEMGGLQLAMGSLVTTGAVVLVAVLAYQRLTCDDPRRRRLAVAYGLAFAAGTAAWSTASRALWQHGPSMMLLATAILAASGIERGRHAGRSALALGAASAAAYAVRPTNAVPAVVFGLWLAWRHSRLVPAFVAGGVAVGLPWLAVNAAAYGHLLPPYHSARRLALHGEFGEAVAANLVSPSRGLLVFSPIALLAVAGVVHRLRQRQLGGLEVALVVTAGCHLLVVSASREGWWAGHAYGPRFMADALPLLAYLAVPAVNSLASRWAAGEARLAGGALAVALVWSVAAHAQGGYLRTAHCWNTVPTDIDRDHERVWSLADPQVLAGWRALARLPVRQAFLGPCEAGGAAAR